MLWNKFVLAKHYLTAPVYSHRVRLITDQMVVRAITLGIEEDRIDALRSLYRYDGEENFVTNYLGWLSAPGGKAYTNERTMSITLEVPDSVARSLRLPEGEVVDRLRCELAVALYGQAILSFGKAAELAGVSRYQFGELVTRRGIPRHYGPDELAEDLAYGRGE